MITNETKAQIDKDLEKLFQQTEKTIILGITEDMSPNDVEYYSTLDARWTDALAYMADKIDIYQGAHSDDATSYFNGPGDVFRDVDYMAAECESLAKQLKEAANDQVS